MIPKKRCSNEQRANLINSVSLDLSLFTRTVYAIHHNDQQMCYNSVTLYLVGNQPLSTNQFIPMHATTQLTQNACPCNSRSDFTFLCMKGTSHLRYSQNPSQTKHNVSNILQRHMILFSVIRVFIANIADKCSRACIPSLEVSSSETHQFSRVRGFNNLNVVFSYISY